MANPPLMANVRRQRHAARVELDAKLQIKPGQSVAVLRAPDDSPLVATAAAAADADVVVGFVTNTHELAEVDPVVAAARADRIAWVAYPKAGQLGTDLNRDRLAQALAERGIRPVRQVSIDATWSALRFRPGQLPAP